MIATVLEGWRALAARSFAAPLRRLWRETAHPETPPPRVVAAIKDAEATSEILVSWVQMLGVAAFLILYGASLPAFDMRAGFQPVPVALLCYAAFVIVRLRRSYARKLTPGFLLLSAVLDVTLLMGLIWSFTLQYDAPAALYLKAPTLFYAFILIALRALRFDPKHVLWTGGAAIAGWAVLVAIAARDATVTADYPTYMSSLSLLWGAEAEKVIALLGVTLVLALAVSRARALLTRTAIEETAARDLSRFLDAAAARKVRASQAELKAGDGDLKPMAIMFLDLRGFSAAAATLAPAKVIDILQQYQSRFVPIIEEAGGSVDKYLGDGILVSFGGGDQVGRECADAFSITPSLIEASEAWAHERMRAGERRLDVAVAITFGEVVHGVIGHRDRLEYTVIGDAVNLAAKLEKHAKIEHARVIATKAALDRARQQGAVLSPLREAPGAIVDGAAEPVDLAIIA